MPGLRQMDILGLWSGCGVDMLDEVKPDATLGPTCQTWSNPSPQVSSGCTAVPSPQCPKRLQWAQHPAFVSLSTWRVAASSCYPGGLFMVSHPEDPKESLWH